ncbi:MAG TPA: hypothetical protein VH682_15770 [Gemmataceae bacterium]
MDPTPVTAKYDVKYGTEALIVPSNLNVPIDFMGRLDIDVPPGHTSTASITYPPGTGGGTYDSTVVFLLISADQYPTKPTGEPCLSVQVQGPDTQPSSPPSPPSPPPPPSPTQYSPPPPPPSPPPPSKGASSPRKFSLEFPLVLLGTGAVTTLEPNGNPTVFTFWNASQTTVKFTVRVGRRLKT